jgi:uncharacterized protein with HEPN domain
MFKRDVRLFVADIIDSIKAVEDFTGDIDYTFFFPTGRLIPLRSGSLSL